ncbi:MAG: ZIP family metal transporter [Candidatus Taylorbacteria bacterium]|nr:ZIP family metal transporter [Candidatus Taylorbacteria bacterium]
MLIFVTIGVFIATVLGGLFALRFKDKLHLILGFSAGAVVAVALFELLPEAIELGEGSYEVGFITSLVALGFVIFMIADRFFLLHSHGDDCTHEHHQTKRGYLGAGSISFHSFLDGIVIGLSFQVSPLVGFTVALAVLAHHFSDGLNTVGMIVKNEGSKSSALRWLCVNATAPVLGVIASSFFSISSSTLGLLLAIFGGSFLYIGASDLIPESHHSHPTKWTTVMTVLGFLVLYVIIGIAESH